MWPFAFPIYSPGFVQIQAGKVTHSLPSDTLHCTACVQSVQSNNLDIKGIWTHGNSIVLAWLPIPSFDDILKNNNKK